MPRPSGRPDQRPALLGEGLQAALSPRGAPAEQQTALVDAILDRIRSAGR